MSHISSAYRLLTTCVYVHVRKGVRLLNFKCKFVGRTRTKEIGLVVFVRSSSDGNGARLRFSSANLSVGLARRKKWVSYWCGKHFTSDMAHGDCKSFSECKVTKKNIALQTKSRKTYCFSVTVFRKLKMAIIAMIFCSGSLTHFVTGIVSHFCNSYMLHLCWNHKFRGFQKVSEGFKRWRWFQIVSEGFRWFQMVSRGKNKTLKTKTTFLKTIAITIAIAMSKGSGWKPALLVTVGKCDSICLRFKTMPSMLAGSQYH